MGRAGSRGVPGKEGPEGPIGPKGMEGARGERVRSLGETYESLHYRYILNAFFFNAPLTGNDWSKGMYDIVLPQTYYHMSILRVLKFSGGPRSTW